MTFRFYPLRFTFRAEETIFFPAGRAANILRGAMGMVLRELVCTEACRAAQDSRHCPLASECWYRRFFTPVAPGEGPSGLADPPRPYVFRARHLDGRVFRSGELFSFDIHLFSLAPESIVPLVQTCAAFGRHGVGPQRAKVVLRQVVRRFVDSFPEELIFAEGEPIRDIICAQPVTLSLQPCSGGPTRLQVDFLSPTELKGDHGIAPSPEFPVLFGRVRDRIGNLRNLYGEGPVAMNYQALSARAALVRMTECQVDWEHTVRRSSRTGQTHPLGGFTGTAEYEGDMGEFLPWLRVAAYTGVGRQTVWGKGEIAVRIAGA